MGALLRGIKREQMKRGQVICAVGSLKSVTKFHAQVYVLTKEEGGFVGFDKKRGWTMIF